MKFCNECELFDRITEGDENTMFVRYFCTRENKVVFRQLIMSVSEKVHMCPRPEWCEGFIKKL